MGLKEFFTGADDMSKFEYLEEERQKIWAKILEIETDVQKKTSDYEKDAKQSSRKASEYRNRSEESKQAAFEHLNSIKSAYDELNSYIESAKDLNVTISETSANCIDKLELTKKSYDEIISLETKIRQKIENLEKIFTDHPNLNKEIEGLEEIFTEGEDLQSKINTIHKSSLTRKKEIDQLYYNIIGYTETDEQGEETQVEGMKDILEKSFEELKVK
jgi:DNA repair exonuclease SbcCD ATPase subunit